MAKDAYAEAIGILGHKDMPDFSISMFILNLFLQAFEEDDSCACFTLPYDTPNGLGLPAIPKQPFSPKLLE